MDGNDLMALFVAAWNDCKNPELDAVNPRFGNRYASLRSTLAAVRMACSAHGLAYTQKLAQGTNGPELDSMLLAPGFEPVVLSRFPVEYNPNPQAFGSALTYAKRQQAQLDWGVTGEEDDDAEAAAESAKPPAKRPAPPKPDRRSRMLAKCAELAARCVEGGCDPREIDGHLQREFGVAEMALLDEKSIIEFGRWLTALEEQWRGTGEA